MAINNKALRTQPYGVAEAMKIISAAKYQAQAASSAAARRMARNIGNHRGMAGIER